MQERDSVCVCMCVCVRDPVFELVPFPHMVRVICADLIQWGIAYVTRVTCFIIELSECG